MRPFVCPSSRVAALLAALLSTGDASAEPVAPLLPPWAPFGLPAEARSVGIRRGEQAVLVAPNAAAPRRGTTHEGALLPLFGAQPGPGCRSMWFHVGAHAWVCGDEAELSTAQPALVGTSAIDRTEDGLPFRYHFAGSGGARAYRNLLDFDVTEPAFDLEPGFAVAIVAERMLSGERYGLTRRGLWVRMAEFGAAHPSPFQGVRLEAHSDEGIPHAWVVSDQAPLFRRIAERFVPVGGAKARLEHVDVLEVARGIGGDHLRIGTDQWLRASDVRRPTRAVPPLEVDLEGGEHWIDVDLATQTLVAYEGSRPVFATLVSTGRGKPGSALATPPGTHRIWVKLLGTTMDNLEDANASSYYRIEDVPYVQFFSKGVGLHAAFWHRSFGRVRSHGCVNLAPRDAAFLFDFTGPRMPAGWSAVLPTTYEAGTIVRVR